MRRAIILAALLLAAAPAQGDTIAPLETTACAAMRLHHVLNAGAPVGCERLNLVVFRYWGFDGRSHDGGRIVVLDAVAPAVQRIFAARYERRFPLAGAEPLEAFDGDDHASMAANNTSGFNHRVVPDTARLSLHAYGAAIDLNPVQNPFLMRRGTVIGVDPPAGADFLNRGSHRPGKAERAGLAESVVDVFAANGFAEWGGDWDDPIDYQHFDIGRTLVERLVQMTPDRARAAFEALATGYRRCVAQYPDKPTAERRQLCLNMTQR